MKMRNKPATKIDMIALARDILEYPDAYQYERARRIFQTIIKMHEYQGRPIVYIDESGFAHDMPRTHGYASVGQRCSQVGLFPANITAGIFTAWVKRDLLPQLPENAVIVMDNAAFHKRQDTQDMIRKAGHTLLLLYRRTTFVSFLFL